LSATIFDSLQLSLGVRQSSLAASSTFWRNRKNSARALSALAHEAQPEEVEREDEEGKALTIRVR